jgi:hypothetical protein
MATVGEIAIVVGADVGPMVRELGKGKGALNDFGNSGSKMGGIIGSAMGRATIGVGVAATALLALTKASMSNIDALSKQARAVGISVASFQSMAMVAEEAGVESDQLSKILIKMQDNIAALGSGTKAQVEQFQALGISLSDLSGLGADEQFALIAEKLASITDPAAKTAAALNVFGKSGADAITMLDDYGMAAAQAAEFQAKFGIAVSDVDAQQIEAANDAMGRMWMAAEGLGNVLATALAPAVEATANGLVAVAEALFGTRTEIEEFFGSLEQAKAILGEDIFNKMLGNPADIAANADALDAINVQAEKLAGIAINLEQQVRGAAAGIDAIGETAAASALEAIADEAGRARQEFADGKITAEEFVQKMISIQQGAQGVVQEMANINGSDFSGVIGGLGNLGAALSEALGLAMKLRAALPGTSGGPMDIGTPLTAEGDFMPPGSGLMPDSPRPEAAPAGIGGIDWGAADTGGGGGGGGGGGSNPMTARIAALVESLKTESEIVAEWYAQSLEALNAATEAELEALGGKHEAIERLEEEHQERLDGIKKSAADSSLSLVLGAGEEILSAMGQTNQKALKVAKVFGAAQALISTYQGAAEALKLPFPKNLAAAATVIAKGIGFVNAIKSGGSGGSGGGGGSSSAAAAAAPQAPSTTMNFTITNDPFGYGERFARSIADQMNAARRSGSSIIATVSSP